MTEGRREQLSLLVGWLERNPYVLPIVLLAVGGAFRFYNLDWDGGHQLHPDERGIYMLVSGSNNNPPLSWPTSVAQFFDVQDPTGGSPLNPHYFAYGSLPYYLLALVAGTMSFLGQHVGLFAGWSSSSTYGGLPPVGRGLSATLELLSVYLLFHLGRRVFSYWVGILAMALAACTVLDIQLSHFYQSDTVLLPLVLLTLIAAVEIVRADRRSSYLWGGLALGAALATKTTALFLVIPLGVAAMLSAWHSVSWDRDTPLVHGLWVHYRAVAGKVNENLQWLLATYFFAAAAFALFEPYGILDRGALLRDIAEQTNLLVTNNPPFGVPYTLQYAHTIPYLFQLKNILFWSLGIPLALAAFAGVLFAAVRALRGRLPADQIVLLLWIVPYFLFVGSFFAKFNRYMLPITPLMTLFGAALLLWLVHRFRNFRRTIAVGTLVAVAGGAFLYSLAYMNIYANPNTRVEASRWIFSHIPRGSSIAQEGPWDETLPLDENGHTGSGLYTFANNPDPKNAFPLLDPYAGEMTIQDVTTKISHFTKVLTGYQYIVMSSERMDRSVRRVPDRLPIANRYYDLLFSNRLNFRLIKHFQRHPQLGPFVVHDFSADESFHVYDHPDVRIFKRVSSIQPATVRRLLTTGLPTFPHADPQSLPAILRPVQPLLDSRLMLSSKQWAADQRGDTFDQMFPLAGFAMQHPATVWLLLLEILGLLAFPISFVLFGRLPDRGFVMAKTLGLVLLGYLAWITISAGVHEYTRGLLFFMVSVLALVSATMAYRRWDAIRAAVQLRWKYLLAGEVVFLAAFVFFAFLRMWYPDLGHQFSPVGPGNLGGGRMGEKQMELAFLDSIVRSRVFPPLDPFFSHGYINYYYYGFFLVSALCKLSQIAPATGFNLAIATFGALLLGSVFSVVLALTRRMTPGVLAAVFVGIIGNLNGGWQLIRGLMSVAQVHSSFPLIGGIVNVASGLQQVTFNHQPLPPVDFWESTRIFPAGSISEFPYFTYLFADLHPHLMAYPMAAATIGVAVNLSRGGYGRLHKRVLAALLAGVLVGAIAVTNPWDFPTYLLVVGLGAAVSGYALRKRMSIKMVAEPLVWMGSIACLSLLFYLPFKAGYQTVFSTGVGVVRNITPDLLQSTGVCTDGTKICPSDVHDALVTPLRFYLEHFGLFLFAVVSYLLLLAARSTGIPDTMRRWLVRLQFVLYYRDRLGRLNRARRTAARVMLPRKAAEGSSLWGVLILLAGLIFLQFYLLAFLTATLGVLGLVLEGMGNRMRRSELFVLGLAGFGLLISMVTQVFFVKDFLAEGSQFRMNTIFKFYDQAWLLFAIAAATALYFFMVRQLTQGDSGTRYGGTSRHGRNARVHLMDRPRGSSRASAPISPVFPAKLVPLGAGEDVRGRHTVALRTGASGSGVPATASELAPAARDPATSAATRRPDHHSGRGRILTLVERRPVWSLGLLVLTGASLVYTYGGTLSRESYRAAWLPQNSVPLTLDGMAFMKVAYPGDYAGITWLNAHVRGAQVVAEAGPSYYDWRSRVSMFTGLPNILNGIHEAEQRWGDELDPSVLCANSRNPDSCSVHAHSRADDLKTLYDSSSVAEAWRVIHSYGVRYIFKGFAETICTKDQCYSRGGLAKFDRMVGQGLQIVFHSRGITIYRVTSS